MENVLRELEQAAQIVQAPPNIVTTEQRQQAENVFLSFKKSSMPYELCRYLLEHSKNDYVLFQVASTIKESVVREWSLLQASDIESLRTFLLHYVTQHLQLQNFVREQILQAVAVIIKRGTVDSTGSDRQVLFADVTQLISTGHLSMQLVACSILTALLNEYSSSARSSSVGLTWEFHTRCKMAFEQTDLKKVFSFCLQVLHQLEGVPSPLSREVTVVCNRFLAITEQVLNWEFLPRHIPRRLVGRFSGMKDVAFVPPPAWKDLVLDKGLLDLMFRLHRQVRYHAEMSHHSLQCLAQLASLHGRIFANDEGKKQYLMHYLEGLLDLITSTQPQTYEALGLATIPHNLVVFFPASCFLALPNELLVSFLQTLTKMTCSFGQGTASEETHHSEDRVYSEAYDKLMDLWWNIISAGNDEYSTLLKQSAMDILNSYLQCHLAPPDGTRSQSDSGYEAEAEEEVDETEEDDRDKFRDQLCCVGALAREVPQHSLPLISRLLEERVGRLHNQLERIHQQSRSPDNGSHVDSSHLNSINEDLHWLLLVTANILTDSREGETPMMPAKILQFSISQQQNIDIASTLKMLAASTTEMLTASSHNVDAVVRLIAAVFRVCDVEKAAVEWQLTHLLSPQVSSSLMWFFNRWSQSYLLPKEAYYDQVSMSLNAAFGQDTEGGRWAITFLLDKVLQNLITQTSESALITDTLELLATLVEGRERCDVVIKCEGIWKLAKAFSANQHPVDILPSSSKRLLSRALVLAGSGSFGDEDKDSFIQLSVKEARDNKGRFQLSFIGTRDKLPSKEPKGGPGMALCVEVLKSTQDRLNSLLGQSDLKKHVHEPEVKLEVTNLLECMCGTAEATTASSVAMLFNHLHPALEQCIHLLDLYHNYEEVVQLIFDVFNTVASRQVCYLGQADTKLLYEVSLKLVQMYAKHNIGRGNLTKDAEEDMFTDILTLMDMLTNLLSKDFIDFGVTEDGDSTEVGVCAADVVLYGLDVIVPLMTAELLKFPSLCHMYMRMVTYIGEIYPEKVCGLPEQLFKSLMASIEYGLASVATDIIKMSMEFLASIGTHINQQHIKEGPAFQVMEHFLKLMFNMLLLETFDMDLLETASTTFFTLICCHQDSYKTLVNELLSHQAAPAYYQRLVEAFNSLTPATLPLVLNRPNKIQFMQNFDSFLVNVRGILCVK